MFAGDKDTMKTHNANMGWGGGGGGGGGVDKCDMSLALNRNWQKTHK